MCTVIPQIIACDLFPAFTDEARQKFTRYYTHNMQCFEGTFVTASIISSQFGKPADGEVRSVPLLSSVHLYTYTLVVC